MSNECEKPSQIEPGFVTGKVTVTKALLPDLWECVCACGREQCRRTVTLSTRSLGKAIDCGSLELSGLRKKRVKGQHEAEYHSWYDMIRRCTDSEHVHWRHYGGRGIQVHISWRHFDIFFADMGLRPTPEHTLDRIDVNGNYSKANCRWADRKTQANNKRPKAPRSLGKPFAWPEEYK